MSKLSTPPIGRYLIDYENPDAGIGHSLGHVNNAIKVCQRHGLSFAYSDKQLTKSRSTDLKWRLRQLTRTIVGRKAHESHNIGDAICRMFAFDKRTVARDTVETLIRKRKLKVIELPGADIAIPSNQQDDGQVYAGIDAVVRAHPEDGVVFVLPGKRTGDFEYGSTRDWFKQCYVDARGAEPNHGTAIADKKTLHVAVHIRRGDLLPGRQFADLAHRMLPDRWYVGVIEALQKACGLPMQIVILSEGVDGAYRSELGEPFSWSAALASLDCTVRENIDGDFSESFHEMVSADVLIGSKSGMTHLAGLMNDGLKLMPGMWHSYRGTRHVLELPDSYNTAELDSQVQQAWLALAPR
jgi:hypothetical protein